MRNYWNLNLEMEESGGNHLLTKTVEFTNLKQNSHWVLTYEDTFIP